jgi:ABC-type antimicrobial peptide transport system permease subunit
MVSGSHALKKSSRSRPLKPSLANGRTATVCRRRLGGLGGVSMGPGWEVRAAEHAPSRKLAPARSTRTRSFRLTGALVKIGGNWYQVIGVLAASNSADGGPGDEDENAGRDVYLPITQTFAADAFRRQALAEAWVAVDGKVDPEAAAPVLERALERRHGGRQHFAVTTAGRLLAEHRATRGLLNQLLLLVSLAAFALGGVGMMTVSWQNVRNRTREIAIRRAVGARREEVLAQFVLEGVVLALAGAILGVVVGLAGSGVAAWIGGWPWMLSPLAGLLALAVALAVATLSTLYPAAHAAALDPVSALKLDR